MTNNAYKKLPTNVEFARGDDLAAKKQLIVDRLRANPLFEHLHCSTVVLDRFLDKREELGMHMVFRRVADARPRDRDEELECTLYVQFHDATGKSAWGGGDTYEASDGSLWLNLKVSVKVSWPSWGETHVDLARERLDFMMDVTTLGRDLERVPHVWMCDETADERTDREMKTRRLQAERTITNVIQLLSKGLRKRGTAHMPLDEISHLLGPAVDAQTLQVILDLGAGKADVPIPARRPRSYAWHIVGDVFILTRTT